MSALAPLMREERTLLRTLSLAGFAVTRVTGQIVLSGPYARHTALTRRHVMQAQMSKHPVLVSAISFIGVLAFFYIVAGSAFA